MKQELLKILGSIGSECYDEFSANMMLAEIRRSLAALVSDYVTAVVLVDRGDSGFELCELEVPTGTSPDTVLTTLTRMYQDSGYWSPGSILLALRWVADSEVLELPFDKGGKPAPKAVTLIPTAVPNGAMVMSAKDAYSRLGHKRRDAALRQ